MSLISHTNAGKTTLARTLLQRDIGEVRDAPHVTEWAEDHLLLRTDEGDELRLWDTPGFGDTVRLVQRLRRDGSPMGWFLSQVWDRWRDRPFWANQQALRHVREQSDVVLYLVNAAESPQAASYVEPEMQLLAWMDKPVIVLLNQLGVQRTPAEEAVDVQRWQSHLRDRKQVHQVLPLDAFARCWVQELTLLQAVTNVLPPVQQAAAVRLKQAWMARHTATFDKAVQSLAQTVAQAAATRVALDGPHGLAGSVKQLSSRVGRWLGGDRPGQANPGPAAAGAAATNGPADGDSAAEVAQRALVARLDEDVRRGTGELIALHGLSGQAQSEVLQRVAQQIQLGDRVDESRAAVWGGVVTGAMAGLKADVISGGLTLGGGMLAGGLLGALGAAGLARGINVMRGGGPAWVGWNAAAMTPIVQAALLRYLAVAHFGRGRGQWEQGEVPLHWRDLTAELLASKQPQLAALWATRSDKLEAQGEAERLEAVLQPLLRELLLGALAKLYPQALTMLET